jgi:hypothetical protein
MKYKYRWQTEYKLRTDSYVRVFEAVKSNRYRNQEEVANATGLDPGYVGKILSVLRGLNLVDKVWVVKESEE